MPILFGISDAAMPLPREGRKLLLYSKRLPPASAKLYLESREIAHAYHSAHLVRGVEVRVQITVGSDGSVTLALPLSKADNAIRPPRKKLRWKPGTVALREIRKYQGQTSFIHDPLNNEGDDLEKAFALISVSELDDEIVPGVCHTVLSVP